MVFVDTMIRLNDALWSPNDMLPVMGILIIVV